MNIEYFPLIFLFSLCLDDSLLAPTPLLFFFSQLSMLVAAKRQADPHAIIPEEELLVISRSLFSILFSFFLVIFSIFSVVGFFPLSMSVCVCVY